MVYNKAELDDAFKDKRFDDGVRVELIFDNTDDQYPDGERSGMEELALIACTNKHNLVKNILARNTKL